MVNQDKIAAALENVAQAEKDVDRQLKIIAELRRNGHSTKGAEAMLRLLQESLEMQEETLAVLRRWRGAS